MSADTLGTSSAARPGRRWSRGQLARHLVTPAALAVVLLALYLWVSGQELDSIEARVLDAGAIGDATLRHLKLTAIASLLIVAIAMPLGILLTRPRARWITPVALAAANMGQAAPALGVLVIMAMLFSIGQTVAIAALVVTAILPVLRNTIIGIQQVDRSLVEAAFGMGLTPGQVLRKIELPLAVPVMLAGLRTTIVLSVGVATVATFVNAGGLGDIIVAGIKTTRTPILLTGAVLTTVVAFALDWLAGVLEHSVRPRGL
ncbi:ABC transporter permease [Prauserella muralis]|uniref:ABC transporter permease n=1 Tax=Prauserella muralis TaxID=588067 RepID=A0A2V4ATT0_9PSEU|nr:ABC transporter permease [Prauserella muralis]PXY24663.1 ABC transporter permease [Prauserella muralis]TWE27647.1 osmoprotectant transport system permease protein [Prauserella muralis]